MRKCEGRRGLGEHTRNLDLNGSHLRTTLDCQAGGQMFKYRVQTKDGCYRYNSGTSSDMCVIGGHKSSLSPSGISHPCPQCGLGPVFFSKSLSLGEISFVSLFIVFSALSVFLLSIMLFLPPDCFLSILFHFDETISISVHPTWK